MRRSLILLVAFGPLLHFACVDDPATPLPDVRFDAGSPAFDGSIPDGAFPEDDSGLGTGPIPVTVQVVRRGAPLAGVTVVYGDADGAVLETGQTDATGRVARVVPPGSQVTALLGTANTPRWVTVVAVEPGDVLTAIDPGDYEFMESATLASMPTPPPTGTQQYAAFTGYCVHTFSLSNELPTPVVPYQESCQKDGVYPLLLLANSMDGGVTGYAYQKGNVYLADGGTAVSVPGPWLTTLGAHTIALTRPPTDTPYARAVFTEWADGVRLSSNEFIDLTSGESASATFPVHTGYADSLQAEISVGQFIENTLSLRAMAARVTAGGTTSFDLTNLLPEIASTALDTTDRARPTTTWTSEGSLDGTDALFVGLAWSQSLADGGHVDGRWTFVAPPSSARVTAPTLPAEVVEQALGATPLFSPPTVAFLEASFVADYRQLRSVAATLPLSQELSGYRPNQGITPELRVDGVVRWTASTAPND